MYIYIYTHTHLYIHTDIYIYIYIYVCICIYIGYWLVGFYGISTLLFNISNSIYHISLSNSISIFCLHTVKWFQVLLFNANNSIQHHSFICTQLNGFKYRKWLSISVWSIGRILTSATTPGQSGPRSNINKGVLHIPQSYRAGTSPSDGLVSYLGHSLGGVLIPLQRCSWYIL